MESTNEDDRRRWEAAPVALVVGASRGIGEEAALCLARAKFRVAVAAKSVQSSAELPGSVHVVTEKIQAIANQQGRTEQRWALPIQCDVRSTESIDKMVQSCLDHFGRIDFVVYNAGAIWWAKVPATPTKRFDLMHEVNARGCYHLVQRVLPILTSSSNSSASLSCSSRIVVISPPIYSRFFRGKTAYAMTKVGMTVLVMGLGEELKGTGVAVTALWPATTIESQVTSKLQVEKRFMRKSAIMGDAIVSLAKEPADKYNGEALIDEDYLREKGEVDFVKYRVDPEVEPPRAMPRQFPSLLVAEQNETTLNAQSVKARL